MAMSRRRFEMHRTGARAFMNNDQYLLYDSEKSL